MNEIEKYIKECGSVSKKIPLKNDGTYFTLDDIEENEEQKQVVYLVIQKLKEWIEFPEKYKMNNTLKFSPLHMTVIGAGGTGKSFIISVLVTILKNIIENDKVITAVINAPTGAAAWNVNGTTCHNSWKIPIKKSYLFSEENATNIRKKLVRLILLCIDERSMISKAILGAIDNNAKKTVHNNDFANPSKKSFGGIPIVLLAGDDHQLPSVTINNEGEGIIYRFKVNKTKGSRDSQLLILEENGEEKFLSCAKTVVQLNISKRLEKNSNSLKQILNNVRNGGMSKTEAELLMKRHIRHLDISHKKFLNENAVFLYATKQLMQEHNMQKLNELSNEKNPVLLLQTKFQNKSNGLWNGNSKHYDKDSIPSRQIFCKGAKVAITNKNFQPNWGLYNGALGTVKGIKFKKNENPQDGHLPLYIVVDFPNYCGPSWIIEKPTLVPIPIVTAPCEKKCCLAHFLPLSLAFARTIHRFQGMEAGPSKDVKVIVVDVGTTKFEGINPGLLYTALSRASTLGDDIKSSAIYFSGPLTYDRLMNVKYKRHCNRQTTEIYEKVKMRDKWIQHLNENKEKTKKITNNEMKDLKEWVNNASISIKKLDEIINFHKQFTR